MYKICTVQAEGVQYRLRDTEKRVFPSLYCTYCIQAERSNFGMHINQSSPHHELEDNGGFPNFKLLLVIGNAKDMAQHFGRLSYYQVIPGNDQNTIPTNQGATGSKLDWTSYLTFYGSRGNLKSFSGDFLV